MLRRAFIVCCMLGTLMSTSQARAVDISNTWRWNHCQFRSLSGSPASFSRQEVLLTIRCAVDHWPVIGGAPKAMSVADCESGFGPFAVSPTGAYRGVFQLGSSEFASGSRGLPFWHLAPNIFNARSNVVAAIRLAHWVGWGPWSCA